MVLLLCLPGTINLKNIYMKSSHLAKNSIYCTSPVVEFEMVPFTPLIQITYKLRQITLQNLQNPPFKSIQFLGYSWFWGDVLVSTYCTWKTLKNVTGKLENHIFPISQVQVICICENYTSLDIFHSMVCFLAHSQCFGYHVLCDYAFSDV